QMPRWTRGVGAAVRRNSYDVLAWALTAALAATGGLVAFTSGLPLVAIFTTVAAGAVRLGLEIGRRERTAGLGVRLNRHARIAVAAAVRRLVLERPLWHDERATRQLRQAFIDMRSGG